VRGQLRTNDLWPPPLDPANGQRLLPASLADQVVYRTGDRLRIAVVGSWPGVSGRDGGRTGPPRPSSPTSEARTPRRPLRGPRLGQ
jgi:hypothetical protein